MSIIFFRLTVVESVQSFIFSKIRAFTEWVFGLICLYFVSMAEKTALYLIVDVEEDFNRELFKKYVFVADCYYLFYIQAPYAFVSSGCFFIFILILILLL